MRLFIAVPLPPDIKRAVLFAQQALKTSGAVGRFVTDDNFHITLHFIGESERIMDIAAAMHAACRDIKPFVLRLGGYGGFKQGESKTAFVAAACDTDELQRLYESLESELYERGFAKNRAVLHPHITLGRQVGGDDVFHWDGRKFAFAAGEFVLYESRRENGQMHYYPLHRERFT